MFGLAFSLLLVMPGSGTIIQSVVCRPPNPPAFTTPNSSTSSSTDIINGTTSPASSVAVSDNGQHIANVTSDSSGNFALEAPLVNGKNSFSAEASNSCDTVVPGVTPLIITRTLAILPPIAPPSSPSPFFPSPSGPIEPTAPIVSDKGRHLFLQLNVPSRARLPSGYSTTHVSVFISGRTLPYAQITITDNGHSIARLTAAADGSFGVLVPLELGRNRIVVQASLGRQTTSQVVIYIRRGASLEPWYREYLPLIGILAIIALALAIILGVKRWRRKTQDE
jgi:hypothetical protein